MTMHFFATCAKGTEGALRRELVALKLPRVRGDRGGVAFEGELEAGMRACLHARTAMRVLLELGRFQAPSQEALYEGTKAIAWEEWLTAKTTLAVEASVSSSAITHSWSFCIPCQAGLEQPSRRACRSSWKCIRPCPVCSMARSCQTLISLWKEWTWSFAATV